MHIDISMVEMEVVVTTNHSNQQGFKVVNSAT